MTSIIWYIKAFFYLLFARPDAKRFKRLIAAGREEEARAGIERRAVDFVQKLMRWGRVECEVEGLEHMPEGRCVIAANHQSNVDPILMLTCLGKPCAELAKIEIKKLPMVPEWMELLGCVFIDRGNARRSVEALNKAAAHIEKGNAMIIFPEGTRSGGAEVGEYKYGALRIAEKTCAPIVPVCISGTYRIMERGSARIRPGKVRIRVLPPVSLEGLSRAELRALPEQLRAITADNVKEMTEEE